MAGLNNDQTPIQGQVRLGTQYIQLVPGPPGPAGPAGGVTTTTASFTQPAVGSTVQVSATTTAGLFAGLNIAIQGGGYYQVTAVNSGTLVTVVNLGSPGNATANATINNGAILSGSGPNTGVGAIFRANHAGSPYTLTVYQLNVFVDVSGGVVTLNLPTAPADGTVLVVNNSAGDASASNITVTRGGADTIQDPNNIGAAPTTSVTLKIKGASVTWIYGATEAQWRLQ